MAGAEREKNLFQRTIGSEGFERFSRKPIAVLIGLLGIILGPQAMIEAINQIEQNHIAQGITAAVQGTLEIGIAASLGVANIKSRRRVKPPTTH